MWFHLQDKVKLIGAENKSVAGAEGGEKLATGDQPEGIYGMMDLFHMLIVAVLTQLYGFVKSHGIVNTPKSEFYYT